MFLMQLQYRIVSIAIIVAALLVGIAIVVSATLLVLPVLLQHAIVFLHCTIGINYCDIIFGIAIIATVLLVYLI